MFRDEVTTYSNPQIRLVRIPLGYNFHGPQKQLANQVQWHSLTPENAWEFAALGYFFAKDQYEQNGVPQGMISAGIGGTPAQAWISMEGLREFPEYQNEARYYSDDSLVEEIRRTGHKKKCSLEPTPIPTGQRNKRTGQMVRNKLQRHSMATNNTLLRRVA